MSVPARGQRQLALSVLFLVFSDFSGVLTQALTIAGRSSLGSREGDGSREPERVSSTASPIRSFDSDAHAGSPFGELFPSSSPDAARMSATGRGCSPVCQDTPIEASQPWEQWRSSKNSTPGPHARPRTPHDSFHPRHDPVPTQLQRDEKSARSRYLPAWAAQNGPPRMETLRLGSMVELSDLPPAPSAPRARRGVDSAVGRQSPEDAAAARVMRRPASHLSAGARLLMGGTLSGGVWGGDGGTVGGVVEERMRSSQTTALGLSRAPGDLGHHGTLVLDPFVSDRQTRRHRSFHESGGWDNPNRRSHGDALQESGSRWLPGSQGRSRGISESQRRGVVRGLGDCALPCDFPAAEAGKGA